jgi:TolB protein
VERSFDPIINLVKEKFMRFLPTILSISLLVITLSACGLSSTSSEPSSYTIPTAGEPSPGIAFVSERDDNKEIYLIQPDGSGLTRLTDDPDIDADPTWSPDGRQIAFRSRRDATTDIFIMNTDGSQQTNMIRDPAGSLFDEFYPAWSPDGETLALITDRFEFGGCSGHTVALMPVSGGMENIQHIDTVTGNQRSVVWSPDGQSLAFSNSCNQNDIVSLYLWHRKTSEIQRLTTDRSQNIYPSWSHDGRFLAFTSTRDGNAEIYKLELATGTLTNLTNHPARDIFPTWSSDDSHIAFTSDRTGNDEIFVMSADGSNLRKLTNHPRRDFHPAWSPIP